MTRNIYRDGLVATVSGTGPPMMLIHGLGSNRAIWRTIDAALSERFQVVAVDLVGHGNSRWSDPAPRQMTPADHADSLRPFIEDFGPMHLIGSSMGGWVALEMAANGWASSLTALCPAGLEFDPWVSRSDVLVQRRRLARILGPATPPTTQLVSKTPGLRNLLLGDVTADFDSLDKGLLYDAANAMRDARGFYSSHDGMLNTLFTRPDEVPESTPVAVVWGTKDELLPPAAATAGSRPSACAMGRP